MALESFDLVYHATVLNTPLTEHTIWGIRDTNRLTQLFAGQVVTEPIISLM